MNIIQVNNISKKIKNTYLLKNISLKVKKGDIATLEGINGSGKTLLLKAILGLIKTEGDIFINQVKVMPEEAFPIKAGILIENPSLIENISAFKNLELLSTLQQDVDDKDINNILEEMNLINVKNKKVKNFSLGMKQKLGISQALLGNHPLIILDEPTNALDSESLERLIVLIQNINKKGSTFIIASHDHDFIDKISTNRLKMEEGRIIEN